MSPRHIQSTKGTPAYENCYFSQGAAISFAISCICEYVPQPQRLQNVADMNMTSQFKPT